MNACRFTYVCSGASVVGAEDLIEQIKNGDLSFTRCIATPEMMPLVGKVAKVSRLVLLFSGAYYFVDFGTSRADAQS